MGDTNRLIERLKVPKIWDKQHRVCPRKRCILAVLLYRQQYKDNKRYRTISDIANPWAGIAERSDTILPS